MHLCMRLNFVTICMYYLFKKSFLRKCKERAGGTTFARPNITARYHGDLKGILREETGVNSATGLLFNSIKRSVRSSPVTRVTEGAQSGPQE